MAYNGRMSNQRTIAWSLVAGLALTAVSGLAFANNVAVVARWASAFRAAAGDTAQMPATVPGPIPWLDWSAVDYSCVSTFLPFLGFALATLGLARLLRGRRAVGEAFPFFRSYDQMNVAFGLIGTLWGIIMIGYYDMETVTMSHLLTCLHTALFSTLVAVVWVYVVDHPLLRPFLQHLADAAVPETFEEADAMQILERLRYSASALRETWEAERERLSGVAEAADTATGGLLRLAETGDRAQRAFETSLPAAVDAFAAKLGAAADAFDARQRAYDESLTARLSSVEASQAELVRLSEALAQVVASLQAAQKESAALAARTAADNDALRARATAEAAAANEVRERASELSGTVAALERETSGLRDDIARRAAAAEKADAVFRERLDALAQERNRLDAERASAAQSAADSAQRAEKAETLLARIRSAFQP